MVHYQQLPDAEAQEFNASILGFLLHPKWAKNSLAWQQVLHHLDLDDFALDLDSDEFLVVHLIDPIHHAAAHGLRRLTQKLLQNGYDPNAPGGEYGHPVLAAARSTGWGRSDTSRANYIQYLLDSGSDIRKPYVLRGLATELSLRWTLDNLDFLRKLLAVGAFEKHPNQLGTILEGVARYPSDHEGAERLLLNAGANPSHRVEISSLLRSDRFNYPPLQAACKAGNRCIAILLLSQGAQPNLGITDLGTPLQAAVIGGNEDIVELLFNRHADPNISGGLYGTPLQAAASYGRINAVRALLDKGADVNVKGGHFGSALSAAIARGNRKTMGLLLQQQPNPNGGEISFQRINLILDENIPESGPNGSYSRPINWAIKHGDVSLVSKLVDLGAELNSATECFRDENAYTNDDYNSTYHPLCVSISMRNTTVLDFLLEKGSNSNAGDYCATRSAARSGMFDIFERLVARAQATDMERICSRAFFWSNDEDFMARLLSLIHEKDVRWPQELKDRLLWRCIGVGSLLRVKH